MVDTAVLIFCADLHRGAGARHGIVWACHISRSIFAAATVKAIHIRQIVWRFGRLGLYII